jgi:hypothetical protein
MVWVGVVCQVEYLCDGSTTESVLVELYVYNLLSFSEVWGFNSKMQYTVVGLIQSMV